MGSKRQGSKDQEQERGDRARPAETPQDGELEAAPEELDPLEMVTVLGRLDLEAAVAYGVAAEAATDPELRAQLERFREDHLRHVEQLNRLLRAGDEPELAAGNPSGMLLASLARVAGPLGDEALLVAILANEQLTNVSYEEALAYEWEQEVERLLEEFRLDEERHLTWLTERYDDLAAEPQPGAPA